MPEQKPTPRINNSSARLQPGADIIVQKQAIHFPEVGMTLSSYKRSALDNNGVRRGQSTLPRPVDPPVSESRPKAAKKKRRTFVSLKRAAIALVVVVLLVIGWVGFKFVYNTHKVFGGNILSVLSTTKLKGESSGRVNILLAGNSADDYGHDGAQLTDSIMIMSIDTKNHKAFLMSVPRDLWVDVGDNGHSKINAAYVYGEENEFNQNGYPKGGMGQLQQVIEQNFGLTIHYYALVNYSAFKEAVDAVGGIDFTVASTDPRGLYDPSIDWTTHGPLVKLTNGVHHLSGQQALNLSRARGDAYGSYGFPGSDFDRTEHQRQMLVALKSKIVSAGTLSNPAKLTSLSDVIGGNVKSNMTISEVRRLYDLTKGLGSNAIQSVSLNKTDDDKNLLMNYQTTNGQSALIPAAGVDNFDDIQAYLQRLMSSDPVVQEHASVIVLNATDTSGVASTERTALQDKNINVVSIGNALTTQATTTIIDVSKGSKAATKTLLGKMYGNHFTTTNPYAQTYDADFIVLVGADKLQTNTTNQ